MIKSNEHYAKLKTSYFFSDINRRVADYQKENPGKDIIKMGIGDVTRPLPEACIKAFHQATDEMAAGKTFRGYGPEQGYPFLREAIAQHDFIRRGVPMKAQEIYVSDGSKCDTGNFQEIFSFHTRVGVPDPVYPVYVDTHVMAGRTGDWKNGRYEGLYYFDGTVENGFVPDPPEEGLDLIYLCFPNNPTGAVASREQLGKWVRYAEKHGSLILFDAAYEAFIRDDRLPRSIFEIPGARNHAVEFRSFSKTAGFTGTRCAYAVIPEECRIEGPDGKTLQAGDLWIRRQTTKFNGVSYPVQRAAEAVYSPEGLRQTRELTDYYLANARVIRDTMTSLGFTCTGGENAPYIWIKTSGNSWEFFDFLLRRAQVVCTPGSGFGSRGEGYIRLSAFNDAERVREAMERITAALSV
ncbi:MAG: LL-diaminopimelate aminotransferase [Spirochaetales bacterium]|nr:LL-diaminopimelate aminotransferase [Spirochaetales bacterium]